MWTRIGGHDLANGAGALMRVDVCCMLDMCMVMHVCNTAIFTCMQRMCMATPDEREGNDCNYQKLADQSAHGRSKAAIAVAVKALAVDKRGQTDRILAPPLSLG
jgi:hypothetical protein